jgi:biotin---protein ligase
VYDQEDGAKAAAMTVEESLGKIEGEVRVYCNGGGIFVDADSLKGRGVEVLSRFKDKVSVEGGDAAVVYCKVGTGAAILTGIHPEYAPLMNLANGPESAHLN